MPSSDSPSLPSLLYRLERNRDLRRKTRNAVSDLIQNRKVPNRKLIRYIERMRQLAQTEHWLWEVIAELVHYACRNINRLRIQLAQIIEWIDDLSRYGDSREVQRCLSALIQNGRVVPPNIVYRWIEGAVMTNGDKPAALMLLAHPSYAHWSNLKIRTLCYWLEQSLVGYNGNHGVFRFFGVLVRRLKYVKDTAAVVPEAVERLANALLIVGKYDEYFFESLVDDLKGLRPSLRAKVRSRFLLLAYEDGKTAIRRRVKFESLAPATK